MRNFRFSYILIHVGKSTRVYNFSGDIKMKNFVTKYKFVNCKQLIIVGLVLMPMLTFLVGCSGAKEIQGTWYVQNSKGKNLMITFTDKKVSIDGDEYKYTQNAIGTENGAKYYGITQNGKTYSIIFPEKDENIALMIEPESTDNYLQGTLLFAMNKKKEPNYSSYAQKYIY